MAKRRTITVQQHANPRFDSTQSQTDYNYPYVYRVVRVTNNATPPIYSYLSISELRTYTDDSRFNVTILPYK